MVQIDMKMPNNCMVCPLLSYIPHENGDDEPVCYYTGDDLPEGYFHHNGGRPEFCPLKEARKPHILSLDEAAADQEVWTEILLKAKNEAILIVTRLWLTDDVKNFNLELMGTNKQSFQLTSEYGKVWRCWSEKPTDEQRQAVKWE